MNTWRVVQGDVREKLAEMPDASVRCCVTSPPYWGLRDYGVEGQLGLEKTPDEFVAAMVSVFREVRRVLSDDGTLWLNLGDSYAASGGHNTTPQSGDMFKDRRRGQEVICRSKRLARGGGRYGGGNNSAPGLKPKDLVGIPWMVAFALRADGWYLRQDIVWSKPNPMPESVTDRCTKAHEYIFLLSKSQRYHYDAAAILEPCSPNTHMRVAQNVAAQIGSERANGGGKTNGNMKAVVRGAVNPKASANAKGSKQNESMSQALSLPVLQRNKRSVWEVGTQPYKDAHFATFPEALIEPCILAGSAFGDTVLDPFTGSGTTGAVAIRHQRNFIGTELNPTYVELARKRIAAVAPMFAEEVA